MSTVQANPFTDDDEFNQAFEEFISAIEEQRNLAVMTEEHEWPERNKLMLLRRKLDDPRLVEQLSTEEKDALRKDIVNSAMRGKAQSCVRTSLNTVTEDIGGYGGADYAGVTVEMPEGLLDPSKPMQQSLDEIMKDAWDRFNQSMINQTFGPRDNKPAMRKSLVNCTSTAITSHVLDVEDGARITNFRESLASLPLAEVWKWCKREEALCTAAWKSENKIKTGEQSQTHSAVSQISRHPLTLDDVKAEIARLSENGLPRFVKDEHRRLKLLSVDIEPENLTRLETAFRVAWDSNTLDRADWKSTLDLGTILLDREMIDAATEGFNQPVHEDGLMLAAVPSTVTIDDAWPDDVKADEWDLFTELEDESWKSGTPYETVET